jgi:histidinol-phosphate aminotransferase
VPVDAEHRHDLEAMRREITVATRLAIVCNPNNPTSTALPFEEIAAFVADVPRHVCVILDEAYCEFNMLQDPDESIDLLDRHPNLVLLRTFSKIYGLCGLRVGYALCGSEEFRTAVDQVRQPFFCNAAAQAAALEALNHQDEVTRRVERNLAERIGLEDGLRELGIEPAASQANFVWFDLGDGREEAEVMQGLAQRGVLVRAGTSLGREGALRVTVGTQAENERFLEALGALL